MTSRIARLWQPGNPQARVFLPDFWIKMIETSSVGRNQLPKNAALFEVDLKMSKGDVRQYLEKIYKLPVRDVRTQVVMGEITWDIKDIKYRKALWKEEDRKLAYVFFKKGFVVDFPNLFENKSESDVSTDKMKEFITEDANRSNAKFFNKDRNGVGKFFGV